MTALGVGSRRPEPAPGTTGSSTTKTNNDLGCMTEMERSSHLSDFLRYCARMAWNAPGSRRYLASALLAGDNCCRKDSQPHHPMVLL